MALILLLQFLISLCLNVEKTNAIVATTPPRGWNSYDSYTWIINESQVLENAQAVKKYLAPYGYEYVVIDYLWFQDINDPSHLYIDDYGRLQPDPNRYPHSTDGSGLKWIGDQIHSLGLKFGLHTMRGISSTAVDAKSPIYGTNGTTAADIVQSNSQCNWYKAVSSVNMSKNGSQQFYDSLYAQYAEWGVDFIKNDCVYGDHFVPDQIISVSKAIEQSKREMVYSLSPGNYGPPQQHAEYIHNYTNMYRLTGDDWDNYDDLTKHFKVIAEHAAAGLIGADGHNGYSWPDADMLPLGFITSPGSTQGPYKQTSLTDGQARMQFTLWCMARSPLMFGGEVMALENDSFTLSLITNELALSVNMNSTNNRELTSSEYDENGNPIAIKWAAEQIQSFGEMFYFVALFNVDGNATRSMNVTVEEITMRKDLKNCDCVGVWTDEKWICDEQIIVDVPSQDVAFIQLQWCSD